MQDSTDTIEHKEPVIIEPNITTRISRGGRQLQASAKVYHSAINIINQLIQTEHNKHTYTLTQEET